MPSRLPSHVRERLTPIRMLVLDVDGVLTDGTLTYSADGELLKRFDAKDGLGLKMAQLAGLKVGVLSGRDSAALERRATELKLEFLSMGVEDKRAGRETFLKRHNTVARRIAYIGDDLPDLVVLGQCGLSFAPADAAQEVRDVVHQVLDSPGGHGAVREMVEIVLRARGEWDQLYSRFTFDS